MSEINRIIDEDFSLKGFMLLAVMFLPLAFAAWFYIAPLIIAPTGLLLDWIVTSNWPQQFPQLDRIGHELEVYVRMALPEQYASASNGRVAVPALTYNPMIYGYGLPLLAGLALASPISIWKRLVQILAGFVLTTLIMTWGTLFELFKDLKLRHGEPGLAVMSDINISADVIALCYQFGYLIFPGVLPAILWVLMNRVFIEYLVIGSKNKTT